VRAVPLGLRVDTTWCDLGWVTVLGLFLLGGSCVFGNLLGWWGNVTLARGSQWRRCFWGVISRGLYVFFFLRLPFPCDFVFCRSGAVVFRCLAGGGEFREGRFGFEFCFLGGRASMVTLCRTHNFLLPPFLGRRRFGCCSVCRMCGQLCCSPSARALCARPRFLRAEWLRLLSVVVFGRRFVG